MEPLGWARRLDDRADRALRRRFGFGVTGDEDLSLGRHLAITMIVLLFVLGALLVAFIWSGQAHRAWSLLGPAIGALLGVVLGRALRKSRK